MINIILKSRIIKSIILVCLFFSGFHGVSKAGGITFEIYLNNKLLLNQRYNKIIEGSPDLQFASANKNDNLHIFFRSCGVSSSTRSVGIKTENNELLKKWDFANSTSSDLSMTIPISEIMDLQKQKPGSTLKLFYFSPDQFRDGYMLASVLSNKTNTASNLQIGNGLLPAFTAGVFVLGTLGWIVRRKVKA
ncbi:MAG: hypothetical protein QM764_01285 [Chitinophagaceae bacterium]